MADDKSKIGGQDRRRVAVDQDYEVRHFAERRRLATEKAREIIEKYGASRDEADAAAERARHEA